MALEYLFDLLKFGQVCSTSGFCSPMLIFFDNSSTAASSNHLDSFLHRCVKQSFWSTSDTPFLGAIAADIEDTLFNKILCCDYHILQSCLSDWPKVLCNLRKRHHRDFLVCNLSIRILINWNSCSIVRMFLCFMICAAMCSIVLIFDWLFVCLLIILHLCVYVNQAVRVNVVLINEIGWLGSRVVSVLDSGAERLGFKSQPWRCRVTVLGILFTPIVPHVHQAAKLVAALSRVAGVTAGLVESNDSLPPGLWLTSPAGWLPRTRISSGTLCSVIKYGIPF